MGVSPMKGFRNMCRESSEPRRRGRRRYNGRDARPPRIVSASFRETFRANQEIGFPRKFSCPIFRHRIFSHSLFGALRTQIFCRGGFQTRPFSIRRVCRAGLKPAPTDSFLRSGTPSLGNDRWLKACPTSEPPPLSHPRHSVFPSIQFMCQTHGGPGSVRLLR